MSMATTSWPSSTSFSQRCPKAGLTRWRCETTNGCSRVPPDGSTAHEFLRRLVLDGLQRRYGQRASAMRPQVEQELSIIAAVGYEEYFLVVWNIFQDCLAHGIEWITRGSAADSLVCYCLGISDVRPIRFPPRRTRFAVEDSPKNMITLKNQRQAATGVCILPHTEPNRATVQMSESGVREKLQ